MTIYVRKSKGAPAMSPCTLEIKPSLRERINHRALIFHFPSIFCFGHFQGSSSLPTQIYSVWREIWYPFAHNHGNRKWAPWRLKSSSRPPFSTSMIMGERVTPDFLPWFLGKWVAGVFRKHPCAPTVLLATSIPPSALVANLKGSTVDLNRVHMHLRH